MRTPELIKILTQTTERLGELLSRENKVLHQHKTFALTDSQSEKDQLTSAYEKELSHLRRDPSLLKRSDPELVDRLKSATHRFQEVLEEHRRLVQTAKSVTDRMVRTITEEVSKRDRPVDAYDASATVRPHVGKQAKPVSLALNQIV